MKELLLKDLCARIPYGVKCEYRHIQYIENGEIIDVNRFGRVNIDGHIKDICDIKPYLFPLSSMTEEELREYNYLYAERENNNEADDIEQYSDLIDWFNKHHFDYRGLIEKSLALDATNLNIY